MKIVYGTFPEKVLFVYDKNKDKDGFYDTYVTSINKAPFNNGMYNTKEFENVPLKNVKLKIKPDINLYCAIVNDKFSIKLGPDFIQEVVENEGISNSIIRSQITFGQFAKSVRPIRAGSELEKAFKKFSKADPVSILEPNTIYINKKRESVLYLGEFYTTVYRTDFLPKTGEVNANIDCNQIKKINAFISLKFFEFNFKEDPNPPLWRLYHNIDSIRIDSKMNLLVKVQTVDKVYIENLNKSLQEHLVYNLNYKHNPYENYDFSPVIMLYNRSLDKNNVVDKYKKLKMLL